MATAKTKKSPASKAKKKLVKAAPVEKTFLDLTPLEQFFIDGHYKKKPAAWVAVELGISVKVVADRFAELGKAAGDSKFKDSGIVTHREATLMTREASEKGDILKQQKGSGPKSKRSPGLHIIDKNRKSY